MLFAQERSTYGDHLISVHPYVGYATPQVSDLGIGLAYEHFLSDYISAKVPFNVGLVSKLYQTGVGLKLYPAGHDRPVKYAVGPTLLFTRSSDGFEVSKFDSVNNFFFTELIDNPLTQIGFVLTNSLNVTVQQKFYIGAEMAIGLNYLNNYKLNEYEGVRIFTNEDPNVLFMFTLAMGFRF